MTHLSRALLPAPEVEVETLELAGDERVELERGAEAGADLVLVLDLEQGPGAGHLVDDSLGLLEQVFPVDGALALLQPRRDPVRSRLEG